MVELQRGAARIEDKARQLSYSVGVALVDMGWNGDEGLRPEAATQTLFLSATQRTTRLMLESGHVRRYPAEAGEIDPLLQAALESLAVMARDPQPPTGGGG